MQLTARTTPNFDRLAASRQAGILARDPAFQRFAGLRCGLLSGFTSAEATAAYIRQHCAVASRRDLDTDPAAQDLWHRLRTEYDAWRGKLATPR